MSPAPRRPPGIERRRRRDGSEYTVYRVRFYDTSGAYRCRTFDTEDDALDFQAKVRLARRGGGLAALDAGRETLADFVERWWELEAGPNLARNTLKTYASHWNVHVLPRLGTLELRQVTPQVMARFRHELERDGVGNETIRRTMVMLQGIFARAVEWQLVESNPVRAVRKPKVQRKRAIAVIAPTAVERTRELLLAADRHRDATIVSLLAYAGMRPEEALALEWRHVGKATLLVEQVNIDGRLVVGQKTGRPPRSVELLGPLRQDLAEWQLATGRPRRTELVFPRPDGAPWADHDYRNWRGRVYVPVARRVALSDSGRTLPRPVHELADEEIEREAKRAEIRPRPYDLRHSFASLLLREGRLSVVEIADQLGHSTATLLRTYAHVIAELKGTERLPAEVQIRHARDQTRERREAL